MSSSPGMTATLFAEILGDTHRYSPGVEQRRPTLAPPTGSRLRRLARAGHERCRDLVERAAARATFSHRHFDPDTAGRRLARLSELAEGLDATYALLADEPSRRALIDVLKLRVLGPYHAPLRVSPQAYRERQAYANRELRTAHATFEVSDPWFSPLSLYSVPVDGGSRVALHSHSVDVVSVFLLDQYSYSRGTGAVRVEPGDVVLDIGGCWGDTALYFAALAGPKGKVYTFEFDPESLEILRTNLALNPQLSSRIEIVERALWDRSGETLEFVQAGRMTTVLGSGESERPMCPVSTITIDDFVEQEGLDRLDFVKMDVEGAELKVLHGAREAVQKFAPKLGIAAYHKDDDLITIPAAIGALNPDYRFYLGSFSALEDETVLFAAPPSATVLSSRT